MAHEGFPCSFMPSLRHVSLTCFFSTGELVISAFKKVHIHRTSFGNQLLIWTFCLFVFVCVSFVTPLNACCLYGPLPCTGYVILLLFIDLLKCTDSISSMTENTFYFISHNVLRIHSITQASGLQLWSNIWQMNESTGNGPDLCPAVEFTSDLLGRLGHVTFLPLLRFLL